MFSAIKKKVIKIKTEMDLKKADKKYVEIMKDFYARTVDDIKVKSVWGMMREMSGLIIDFSWIKNQMERVGYNKMYITITVDARIDDLKRMRLILDEGIVKPELA